jgi:hypothetical protein
MLTARRLQRVNELSFDSLYKFSLSALICFPAITLTANTVKWVTITSCDQEKEEEKLPSIKSVRDILEATCFYEKGSVLILQND